VELRRKAVSGVKWSSGATLAVFALEFTQLAILARWLAPGDFGLFALAVLVTGLAHVYADLGMANAIVQRESVSPQQLSSMLWLGIAVALILALVLFVAAPAVAALYDEERLGALIGLASLSLLLAPASQEFAALLQKRLRFDVLAASDVTAAAGAAATAITLAYLGHGVQALVWGYLVNAASRATVLIGFGLRLWRPEARFNRRDLDGYLRFGWYQMGERTINYLGFNLDKLLLGALIGAHGLGLYSVAYQLVMKPMQVVNPIVTRVAFPIFAILQADNARLREGFLHGLRFIALLLFPAYAGMIVLAEPAVLALLGETWQPAIPILQVLCVLGFFYAIGNPMGSLIVAKGEVRTSFLLNVWMVALYAAAIWSGAHWGAIGVAAGLVLAQAFGLFPVGFWLRRRLIDMRAAEYVAALVPMFVSAVVMAAAIALLRALGPAYPSALVELAALVPAGAILYLALVLPWQRSLLSKLREALR
jgi:O-antigen/teichoic acid export membrane protein